MSHPLVAERWRREELPEPAFPAHEAFDRAAAPENVLPDDLAREVYCVLGIPIDAISMPEALRRIRGAAAAALP
jgi:hypothetical protein